LERHVACFAVARVSGWGRRQGVRTSGVVLFVWGLLISGCSGVEPRADARGTLFEPSSREELLRALAERDAEISQLKAQVATLSEETLAWGAAVALGVADAVEATGLPARTQRRIAIAIVREAEKNGLDPLLVTALIRVESSFNNYAVSPVGARGLMQVMPDTGSYLLASREQTLRRPSHLFDSELNIELGTFYLADLIRRFHSVEAALVAYNAGPGAARRILKCPQSRARFVAGYPRKVLTEMEKLQKPRRSTEVATSRVATGGSTPQ
jgi:soluble lytic murein transglycosylase